jgi:hypothetical protein
MTLFVKTTTMNVAAEVLSTIDETCAVVVQTFFMSTFLLNIAIITSSYWLPEWKRLFPVLFLIPHFDVVLLSLKTSNDFVNLIHSII